MPKVRSVASASLLLALSASAAVPPVERIGGEGVSGDDPASFNKGTFLSGDNPYAPPSEGDEDLGEQVILQRQRKWAPIRLNADAYLFWSNNLGSDAVGEDDGWYTGGSVSARWTQPLWQNWSLDTYAYQDAYIYDSDGLDFQSTEFGIGLLGSIPALANLSLYARYEFLYVNSDNPFFGPLDNDEYLGSRYHRLRIGAYKELYANAGHLVSLSGNGSWDFDASSGSSRREQVSARLAYTWQATERFRATAYYRASFRNYLASSREDWNQYVGLELHYTLADWAEAYGSLLYGVNDSNDPSGDNDYEALQAGLGVGMRVSF